MSLLFAIGSGTEFAIVYHRHMIGSYNEGDAVMLFFAVVTGLGSVWYSIRDFRS